MNIRKLTSKKLTVAVVATLGLGALVGCALRVPTDYVVLHYSAGAEDRKFVNCVEPGTSEDNPGNDDYFALPTSLRTWNISDQGGDTNVPITSGSRPSAVLDATGKPTGATQPGPEVTVWGSVDFYLNTDCTGGVNSPVVQFWERTGRRSWKDGHGVSVDSDGSGFSEDAWKVMLQNTLVVAEQAAVRQQTRLFSADDMDANVNDVLTIMARQLGPNFNVLLREKVGGDYFCGPGYVRGQEVEWTEYVADGVDANGLTKFREERRRGRCPPVKVTITDVRFANGDVAKARADVFAAEQRAKAALVDAQSKADVAAKLHEAGDNPAYVELQRVQAQLAAAEACRANPNCTVIIDGTGGAPVIAGRR